MAVGKQPLERQPAVYRGLLREIWLRAQPVGLLLQGQGRCRAAGKQLDVACAMALPPARCNSGAPSWCRRGSEL
eukprot:1488212-Alexandrium_andersonii.AAC.1